MVEMLRVVDWGVSPDGNGPMREVQLPKGSAVHPSDVAALVAEAVAREAALKRGELRRVKRPPGPGREEAGGGSSLAPPPLANPARMD